MITVDGVQGHLLPGDIDMLRRLARSYPAPVIAEIGSLYGLSAITMAKANPQSRVYCHDTWGGPPIMESPGDAHSVFMRNVTEAGVSAQIVSVPGDSKESAAKYRDGTFDLVWIDGDHSEAGCYGDLAAWWPKCSGRFVGHDGRLPEVAAAVARFAGERGLKFGHHAGTNCIWEVLR